MTVYFVDTSALYKLYVVELGSGWMRSTVAAGAISLSLLALVEMGVTLSRDAAAGRLTPIQSRAAWARFRRELRSIPVVDISRASMLRAVATASRLAFPVRTLDAIHLQAALDVNQQARRGGTPTPTFVSADARLLAAAAELGFQTDNPNDHP